MRKVLFLLLSLAPLAGATVAAGVISSPSKEPCVTGYAEGFTGGPTHVEVGPDGDLWANEGLSDRIAHFDLETKRAREFPVPKGTQLHELETGPDGDLWFTGLAGRFGKFDPQTEEVELFEGISRGSTPHHIWFAPDGNYYASEIRAGRLARYDPDSGEVVESRYNLPPGNGIHNYAELPDGRTWWTLQDVDQLARFDSRRQRFDKFVDLPKGSGPHWAEYVRSDNAIWVATAFSNDVIRYDLRTGKVSVFDTPLRPITPAQLQRRGRVASFTQLVVDEEKRTLWMGTLGGGELIRFDLDTHEAERVGCGLLFPALTITLIKDRSGDLWATEAPAGPPGTKISGAAGRLAKVENR